MMKQLDKVYAIKFNLFYLLTLFTLHYSIVNIEGFSAIWFQSITSEFFNLLLLFIVKLSSYIILFFNNSIALGFLDTKFQSILSLVLILSYVASDKLFSTSILLFNNSIAFGFVLLDNLRKLIYLGFASNIANAL